MWKGSKENFEDNVPFQETKKQRTYKLQEKSFGRFIVLWWFYSNREFLHS